MATLSAMETNAFDAQSALDAAVAAERKSAEIVTSVWWYAPWYGLSCAALPVATGLIALKQSAGFVALLLCLASIALLVATYGRVTNVWPSGRGMVAVYVAAGVVILGGITGAALLAPSIGLGGVVAIGAATGVAMAALSRYSDRVYARKRGVR